MHELEEYVVYIRHNTLYNVMCMAIIALSAYHINIIVLGCKFNLSYMVLI